VIIGNFAEQHNVRVRLDSCGESVIPGRGKGRVEERHHIYENGDERFGVCLQFDSAKKFGNARRRLLALGFQPRQTGDREGTLLFDPSNREPDDTVRCQLLYQMCRGCRLRNT